jgi:hypothetical protein
VGPWYLAHLQLLQMSVRSTGHELQQLQGLHGYRLLILMVGTLTPLAIHAALG